MPLENINRVVGRNVAGGCVIRLVAVDQVLVVPRERNGSVKNPVILALNAEWTEIRPTRFTQSFSDDWTKVNGARASRPLLEFVISKDRLALLGPLWDIGSVRCLVQHQDENGTIKLIGTKKEPALVVVTAITHGKDVRNDRNQYALTVTCSRRRMVPFYLNSAAESDPVQGCPTLLELIQTADPLTIINALTNTQETFISNYYNSNPACPTLAELIAAATVEQIADAMSDPQEMALLALLVDEIDGGGPTSEYDDEVDDDDGDDDGGGDGDEDPEDYEDDDYEGEDYYTE